MDKTGRKDPGRDLMDKSFTTQYIKIAGLKPPETVASLNFMKISRLGKTQKNEEFFEALEFMRQCRSFTGNIYQ